MSVRLDQRKPTRPELEAYNKVKKLTAHVLSVAKPKEENVNNKHVPKRFVNIGKMMTEIVVEMGADILEANYLGGKGMITIRKGKNGIERQQKKIDVNDLKLRAAEGDVEDIVAALVELGDMIAAQDDAIVELADLIGE